MHRPSGNTVEIVAHRGASVEAPENTLASVDLAWQLGADAVEIDVRLSADGHLVVMHDETLLRTAGIDRRISEMTLSRLRSLDVGTWKGPQWRDERVIELSSVVATVPAGRRLLIELKTGTRAGMNAAIKEAILAALQKTLKRCNAAAESIVLISLSGELIRDAKRRFSHHQALWVVRQTAAATGITEAVSSGWLPDLNDIIRTSSDYGLDGVDLFHSPAITIEAVRQLASAGLSTCVWTVNSVDDARRLASFGIESLTTDDPRAFLQAFGRGPAPAQHNDNDLIPPIPQHLPSEVLARPSTATGTATGTGTRSVSAGVSGSNGLADAQ